MNDLPHYISYIAFFVRVHTSVDPRPDLRPREIVQDFSRKAADRKAELLTTGKRFSHKSSASETNQTSEFS